MKAFFSPSGRQLGKVILAVVSTGTIVFAQDGSIDASFQSPLFGLPVPIIAAEASGKVLYSTAPDGLHFTIGRLSSTGEAESSIQIGDGPQSITPAVNVGTIHLPGATNPAPINVLRPLPNGQVLVGGGFSHFNKVARKLLVRLNGDGTVDTSFNQGTGFEGDGVSCIVLGPGGKIYAGGKFSKFNGQARNVALVRLNADGSPDTSFVDSTISFGATVTACSLQPDGKVIIDTAYANKSFQATLQVFRLEANGGLDASFAQGAGTPAVPAGLRHGLMNNGQILVAGGSGLYNGVAVNSSLFRLNPDGTVDAAFSGLSLGFVNLGGLIARFIPTPSGSIYISGAFDTVSGQKRQGIARLNPDSTLDAAFVPGAAVSALPGAVALQSDGKLLVGSATVSGTNPVYPIVRLNGTGGGQTQQALQIGPVHVSNSGEIQVAVNGATGAVVIQSSQDLAAWLNLSTNSIVNGLLSFNDPSFKTARANFFRFQSSH